MTLLILQSVLCSSTTCNGHRTIWPLCNMDLITHGLISVCWMNKCCSKWKHLWQCRWWWWWWSVAANIQLKALTLHTQLPVGDVYNHKQPAQLTHSQSIRSVYVHAQQTKKGEVRDAVWAVLYRAKQSKPRSFNPILPLNWEYREDVHLNILHTFIYTQSAWTVCLNSF